MAQNTILEFIYTSHLYKVKMYQSFYEQVSYKVQQGSTRKPLKCLKRYSPSSRKARVFKPPSRRSDKICCQRFFSYESFNAKKRKVQYQQATYKKSIKFCRRVFCPTICSIQGKRRIFTRRATYKGNVLCVLNQEIPFYLVHEYWGSEATCLG